MKKKHFTEFFLPGFRFRAIENHSSIKSIVFFSLNSNRYFERGSFANKIRWFRGRSAKNQIEKNWKKRKQKRVETKDNRPFHASIGAWNDRILLERPFFLLNQFQKKEEKKRFIKVSLFRLGLFLFLIQWTFRGISNVLWWANDFFFFPISAVRRRINRSPAIDKKFPFLVWHFC